MLLSCDESLIRILNESHDEYGSKAEESDSRIGSLRADSESIGWLLPLKISGPHSWVWVSDFQQDLLRKTQPSPTRESRDSTRGHPILFKCFLTTVQQQRPTCQTTDTHSAHLFGYPKPRGPSKPLSFKPYSGSCLRRDFAGKVPWMS